jgi:hypothetical protein
MTGKPFIGSCVGSDENINPSGPQKELLTWHWKLGFGMQWIPKMMRETKADDDDGKETILPPVITPKFASTSCCPIPKHVKIHRQTNFQTKKFDICLQVHLKEDKVLMFKLNFVMNSFS